MSGFASSVEASEAYSSNLSYRIAAARDMGIAAFDAGFPMKAELDRDINKLINELPGGRGATQLMRAWQEGWVAAQATISSELLSSLDQLKGRMRAVALQVTDDRRAAGQLPSPAVAIIWAQLPARHQRFLEWITDWQRLDNPQRMPNAPKVLRVAEEEFDIPEMRTVRELCELSSVQLARTVLEPLRVNPSLDFAPFLTTLEALYARQVPLNDFRTSTTLIHQQYSTPAPLSAILGEWVARGTRNLGRNLADLPLQLTPPPHVLEPTAGNGLLTIRFDPAIVAVNELEDTRYRHLLGQGYASLTQLDATRPVVDRHQQFYGVITNPPFGSTGQQDITHPFIGRERYKLLGLEHVIAAHAVNQLRPRGRAAIIIGGWHQYNANGFLIGRDWIFFNYLYAHFHVAAVLHLDSKRLYARQGATWPIRVILLDGVKAAPEGFAPKGRTGDHPIYSTFSDIAQAVFAL